MYSSSDISLGSNVKEFRTDSRLIPASAGTEDSKSATRSFVDLRSLRSLKIRSVSLNRCFGVLLAYSVIKDATCPRTVSFSALVVSWPMSMPRRVLAIAASVSSPKAIKAFCMFVTVIGTSFPVTAPSFTMNVTSRSSNIEVLGRRFLNAIGVFVSFAPNEATLSIHFDKGTSISMRHPKAPS